MENNKVILTGSIVGISQEGKALITTLCILSRIRDQMYADFPSVIWYPENYDDLSKFLIKRFVTIEGELRTSRIVNPDTKQKVYYQNIVGKKIELLDEKNKINKNVVTLTGVIRDIYTPVNDLAILHLEIPSEGRSSINYPNIYIYGSLADDVKKSFAKGDKVTVSATIETKAVNEQTRTINGYANRVEIERCVATDIRKAE